jgi:hypothetical protein
MALGGRRGQDSRFASLRDQGRAQPCQSGRSQSCPRDRTPHRTGITRVQSRKRLPWSTWTRGPENTGLVHVDQKAQIHWLGPRGPGGSKLPSWSTWTRGPEITVLTHVDQRAQYNRWRLSSRPEGHGPSGARAAGEAPSPWLLLSWPREPSRRSWSLALKSRSAASTSARRSHGTPCPGRRPGRCTDCHLPLGRHHHSQWVGYRSAQNGSLNRHQETWLG